MVGGHIPTLKHQKSGNISPNVPVVSPLRSATFTIMIGEINYLEIPSYVLRPIGVLLRRSYLNDNPPIMRRNVAPATLTQAKPNEINQFD